MDAKRRAGEKAAEFVQDGMVVGLGTGSTVYWTIRMLGELVQRGLNIRGVPTSKRTAELAAQLGIPLITLGECAAVDLTIDGADEIDPAFHLIKGGGGALFREKMVAKASRQVIIVADESKLVQRLGAFRLPVEVVPFGVEITRKQVESLGCQATLRVVEQSPFTTDNDNLILDCDFGSIAEPAVLHQSLKLITGVVETGLFTDVANLVIVGSGSGVRILTR